MSKQAIQASKQRKRWLALPAVLAMALVVFGGNYLATSDARASANPGAAVAPTGDYDGPVITAQQNGRTGPRLVHLDPFGSISDSVEVDNNVIGFVHRVCAIDTFVDGIWPNTFPDTPTSSPPVVGYNFQIIDANTHGYPNVQFPTAQTGVNCEDGGDGSGGFPQGNDSILSYYSTEPGEQFITVVDDAGSLVLDFDGPVLPGDQSPRPLVKEWNVLEPTVVAGAGCTPASGTDIVCPNDVFFSGAAGHFISTGGTIASESVFGSHDDGTPDGFFGLVNGALVTFTLSGTCGGVKITASNPDGPDVGTARDPENLLFPNGSSQASYTLTAGDSVTLVSTGARYDFAFFADGDCVIGGDDSLVLTISVEYPNVLGSVNPPPIDETITIDFRVLPPKNKQPLLAWAGQRVVVEHNWADADGVCRWQTNFDIPGEDGGSGFFVTYFKQNGPGSFVGTTGGGLPLNGNGPANHFTPVGPFGLAHLQPDQATVFVSGGPDGDVGDPDEGASNFFPNADCISRVLYESQDPGEVDLTAFVVIPDVIIENNTEIIFISGGFIFRPDGTFIVGDPATFTSITLTTRFDIDFEEVTPISQQVPFLIYYMKLEDVKLGVVAGSFDGHNNGDAPLGRFSNTNPWNTATDTTSATANVSADVLLRAQVRGWFTNSNPSGRPAVPGDFVNGIAGRPVDRWIMPDDWAALAGGNALAASNRPNYDIMFGPDTGYNCTTVDNNDDDAGGADADTLPDVSPESCTSAVGQGAFAVLSPGQTHANVQGPFSLLDTPSNVLGTLGSKAPYNPVSGCSSDDDDDDCFRNTILPDGKVNKYDAPMPPALVTFNLTGSGFLKEAPKANVYSVGTKPYYHSNIPAEPWITRLNEDGSGYLISSWALGAPYRFWDPVARGAPVFSAAGADAAKTTAGATKVATGGWTSITVYSDNSGEAMAIVNGDAGLTFSGCSDAASLLANNIVSLSGHFCELGDLVGSSSITAVADYPDKRKHPPIASNTVTVAWEWGGIKRVDIVPGSNAQFSYVVFTVTDRDRFCGASPSLHPVLGELVDFAIDAGDGIILDTSNGPPTTRLTALGVPTFDTVAFPALAKGTRGGCQAWILVSNSILTRTNVLVIAHDPEGTVAFDRVIDFQTTFAYTLNFRWSLITWAGADNIPVADALKGTGANAAGNDISGEVTAVYGWEQASQEWLAYFPDGVNVPGANDLRVLMNGQAYWIAIDGTPNPVIWTIATNVN